MPSIRGIITAGPDKANATAYYQDGVYNTNFTPGYDQSQIEVLRGPQGTLYGRSATGGAITVTTRDPVLGKYTGNLLFDAGNYGEANLQAAVNVPILDAVAARVAIEAINAPNFWHNADQQDKTISGRLKLLYQPNQDIRVLAAVQYTQTQDYGGGTNANLDANGNPVNPWISTAQSTSTANTQEVLTWGQIDWNTGYGTLTYIPSYRYPYQPPSVGSGPFGYAATYTTLNDTDTQEVRYAGTIGSRINYLAGFYYYDTANVSGITQGCTDDLTPGAAYAYCGGNGSAEANYDSGIYSFVDDNNVHAQGKAVFGQVTYQPIDGLQITGGLRKNWDSSTNANTETRLDVDYPGSGACPALYPGTAPNCYAASVTNSVASSSHLDYLARISYQLTNDNMLFASVSTGYRPGGVTTLGFSYNMESLTAYEIGSKNRFFDNRLELNAGAYYYDYNGFQQAAANCANLDCTTSLGSYTFVIPATMKGAELEIKSRPDDNDTVSFTAAYLDARYTSNSTVAGNSTLSAPATAFVSGKVMPAAPTWELSASYDHNFELPTGAIVTPQIDGQYSSSYLNGFSPDDYEPCALNAALCSSASASHTSLWYDALVKAYVIGNISVSYQSPDSRYTVTAYVKNFGNEIYKATAGGMNSAGPSQPGYSPPRTYGGTLSMSF